MDCRTFKERLEDYLEGGLDFPGRFGMERHAEQCFACGKVVEDARMLGRQVRELKRVSAPTDFEAVLLNRIRREGLSRSAWHSWRWPILFPESVSWRSVSTGVATLVLLGAGIFLVARRINTERQSTEPVTAGPPPVSIPQATDAILPAADEHRVESAGLPTPAQIPLPVKPPTQNSRVKFSAQKARPPLFIESADSEYVEYLVPGPGDRQLVMRLPKTIRMRYGQPSEEYFIRNVSH